MLGLGDLGPYEDWLLPGRLGDTVAQPGQSDADIGQGCPWFDVAVRR